MNKTPTTTKINFKIHQLNVIDPPPDRLAIARRIHGRDFDKSTKSEQN